MSLHSDSLLFQLSNRSAQPFADFLFNLTLLAATIERIQRLTCCVKWNVPAGNLFRTAIEGYQVHQNAIAARPPIVSGVIIHARGRVFENIQRSPRRLGRTPVTSVFEKLQFKLEDFQKVSFISLHFAPPTSMTLWRLKLGMAVSAVTSRRDRHHSPITPNSRTKGL